MERNEFLTKSIQDSKMAKRTPEEQKAVDEFHEKIVQSMVDTLNRNTQDRQPSEP